MQSLIPGHKYLLDNFDDPSQHQTLLFVQKDVAGNLQEDGTSNEEVLSMLVDRLKVLQEKLPSRETAIAITKIEEALLWLNRRTADRIQRGVEGTGKT
jgi:hypothetical protein